LVSATQRGSSPEDLDLTHERVFTHTSSSRALGPARGSRLEEESTMAFPFMPNPFVGASDQMRPPFSVGFANSPRANGPGPRMAPNGPHGLSGFLESPMTRGVSGGFAQNPAMPSPWMRPPTPGINPGPVNPWRGPATGAPRGGVGGAMPGRGRGARAPHGGIWDAIMRLRPGGRNAQGPGGWRAPAPGGWRAPAPGSSNPSGIRVRTPGGQVGIGNSKRQVAASPTALFT
jgi:hypothetical protein